LENNDILKVIFNKSLITPLLTKGWNTLREQTHFQGDTKIVFKYYGESFFKIYISSNMITSNVFPPFHTMSTAPTFQRIFHVTLQQKNSTTSPLVL
jgi:hypothetical protein